MKKSLSRILAFVFATVMLMASTATASAASTPVLVFSDDTSKIFLYQPDPLSLSGNVSTNIKDTTTSDGFWYVSAGKSFLFHIDTNGPFEIFVYQKGGGVIADDYGDGGGYYLYIPETASDTSYGVWIRTLSALSVTEYGVDLN